MVGIGGADRVRTEGFPEGEEALPFLTLFLSDRRKAYLPNPTEKADF